MRYKEIVTVLLGISLMANVFAWQSMTGLRDIARIACELNLADQGECSSRGLN